MRKIPPLLRFLATAALFYVALFSAARIAFWLYFDNPNDPLASGDLLQALYIGLKFDLRIALLVLLPIFLLGWLRFLSPLRSRFGAALWTAYLTLATIALLLFYATDFGHFAYLATRIDISILRFLDLRSRERLLTLAAHRVYWGLPATARDARQARCGRALVTELAFVPDAPPDGMYLLDLQVPAVATDAAPSRPVLYPVREVTP